MPTDPDAPGNEPNLELPSFGFGRRKKRGKKAGDASAEAAGPEAAETPADEEEAPQPAPDEDTAPTAEQAVVPPPSPAPPARPAAARAPAAPPAPARAPAAGPTPPRPPARPAARPPVRPATTATPPTGPAEPPSAPRPAAAAPAPAAPSTQPTAAEPDEAPVFPVLDDTDPTLVDPLGQAATALDAADEARARRRAQRTEAKAQRSEGKARRRADKAERKRSAAADSLAPRRPRINPLVGAIITGALSGLATVLLAFGAARGCDALRGTESCGGGVGLLAVVGILAIEVLIGATLLKACRIADPFSTSFLGVGVVATIAMLAFLDHINSPWMLLVIPLMTAAAFALSWWVTVRVIDEHPMSGEADAERGEPAFRAPRTGAPQETEDQGSRA